LKLREIDQGQVGLVGGKAALLGELSRLEDVEVPAGFCLTTLAYERTVSQMPSLHGLLDRLAHLQPDDREYIGALSAEIRHLLGGVAIPQDVAAAITGALAPLGERAAYAVRSSATAEDLPGASFAGQHDTYLNVVGHRAVIRHVRRCWASLFSERAVTYRLRNGFDHRNVRMAVVVQQMVSAQAAGVLFTADPVSSNRMVASVEAKLGLGESVVSGRVNPDIYKVRAGVITSRVLAGPQAALTDAQVVRLVQLGRRIEAHLGAPQDIEWCLSGDRFQIVQSRPITTLFPIPAAGDGENHVYVSVGHQQMMTDPMKPLGLSVWQLTALVPMQEAGGRLFVDVAARLASPATRAGLLEVFGRGDPLIGDALQTILDRGDFIPSLPSGAPAGGPPAADPPAPIETDPAIVTELITRTEASIAALKREIRTKSGVDLVDFILADIEELKRMLVDPLNRGAIMAGIEATWLLNDHLEAWLGEKNAADTLTQSAPHNVTSEMGLALLDVADVIRAHPDVVRFLRSAQGDDFLDELVEIDGGRPARDAIRGYLDRYGMRCIGEIDITRPRWSERPSALVPMILANIRNFEPGAAARLFESGRRAAEVREQELLQRLRARPDGARKAEEVKRLIERVRTFIGYREYPKYGIVSRYFVYKQALLKEVDGLVQAGVLREAEESFYLTLQELRDAVRTRRVDDELIRRRREAFRLHQTLTPPRVLTSEGEVITGAYRRDDDVPEGALIGLAVSAGSVEGRARVLLDVAQADLEAGDILVTAYTDPSWSPMFVAIGGLVAEVGGQMTHGAVIAREYGLPAVVGVERATELIREGQRIRVDGTHGLVEVLD
jgi:pyruvate,water dikinase